MPADKENNIQHFLDLIKKSRRGKFKIYIGMSAGVGKTYRMLQEARSLLKNGIDVKIGYIETHFRKETHELLEGLPLIPRRTLFYKGKELEELDVQAVINLRPEVVIIDELAHTNIEGSKNEKRWQDVIEIIDAGINVISAVNIQHIESLNEEVKKITGVEVKERIPDSVVAQADEVVNIDLTADELISRLKEGKIYKEEKIETALKNFFKNEHILQLRELALKEVASQVERKVETEVTKVNAIKHEKFLACISSNEITAKTVIRKTARLANYYHSKWYLLYVQTPAEHPDKIALDKQRHLINHFKLATELGAEIIKVQNSPCSQSNH
ncbi:MAG: sensor protein KdpD [Ferruginibacter sp.]